MWRDRVGLRWWACVVAPVLMVTAGMAQETAPGVPRTGVGTPAQAMPTEAVHSTDQARIAALREEAARLRAELAQLLESVAAHREQGSPATQSGEASPSPTAAPLPNVPTPEARTVAEVYFPTGSAQVAPADRQRLTGTAEALRALGVAKVQVIGYCDHTGSLEINKELTAARAHAVARELAAAGFDEGIIEAASHIDLGLPRLVPTAAGVSEPLNRRVRVVAVLEPQGTPQPVAASARSELVN